MEWLGPFIERFGVPLGLLIIGSIGIWRVVIFIGKRLFDEDSGFITILVKEHVTTMRDHRTAMANILASTRETADETTKTNPALMRLAIALQTMADAYGVNIDHEIDRIKEILKDD